MSTLPHATVCPNCHKLAPGVGAYGYAGQQCPCGHEFPKYQDGPKYWDLPPAAAKEELIECNKLLRRSLAAVLVIVQATLAATAP